MTPDLEKLVAHADATDAMLVELIERQNALISAQGTIVAYDKTPYRDMALQALARSIVRVQEAQGALSPYTRALRLYVGQVEKDQS